MDNILQLKDLTGFRIVENVQFEDRSKDRPDFANIFYKAAFFAIREGLPTTLRKIASSKRYIDSQVRYLTFLIIEKSKEKYINISVQFQKEPDNYVIQNRFYSFTEIDFDSVKQNISFYMQKFNQFVIADYDCVGISNDEYIELERLCKEKSDGYNDGLFVYGLGSYVSTYIMPYLKKVNKIACVDYNAAHSTKFREKYGFSNNYLVASDSYDDLRNTKNPYVIIATYHSDHTRIAKEVCEVNPKSYIFIEKPPCVSLNDLATLTELYKKGARIEIGFNRRYIPFSQYVKKHVKDKKIFVTCSIKEVLLNENHWYFWGNQGSRITGNIVHWIDLATFWINSDPCEINLLFTEEDREHFALAVLYRNGSILNLTSSDSGNSLRGVQEKIEVRFENQTLIIDDYLKLVHIKENGLKETKRNILRDKGHTRMYRHFKELIHGKKGPTYPLNDLIRTTIVAYYASHMQKNNVKNLNIEKDFIEITRIQGK